MQTPNLNGGWAFVWWGPGDDLLSHGQSAISSARRRFTVLFGMGRGGANALWSPGIRLCVRLVGGARAIGIEGSLQMGFALHRVRGVEDRSIDDGASQPRRT